MSEEQILTGLRLNGSIATNELGLVEQLRSMAARSLLDLEDPGLGDYVVAYQTGCGPRKRKKIVHHGWKWAWQ